jgi:hypothetical protein
MGFLSNAVRRRKNSSARLIHALAQRANSFESHADAPAAVNPAATRLGAVAGNPGFAAQFDVQFLLKYFSVAAGAYTSLTAAALLAAQPTLANKLPVFLFGNSDFAGGFTKLKSLFTLTNWTYGAPFIYGKDYPFTKFGALDATAKAVLSDGDLVIPFEYEAGATDYVAFAIVRCSQVGYGTLLDALNSDMFTLNTLRYIMSDTSAVGLAQYNNNINIMKQSLFGKFDSDFVSPNSFKLPEQQQSGIIDIPLIKGVDKQIALATYINYDAVSVQWSLFVRSVNKLDY